MNQNQSELLVLVSQRVLDGQPAGFLYREKPMQANDSGWRVFTGDEDGAYLADPAHLVLCERTTLLAQHPELVALIDGPLGRVWERVDGQWSKICDQGEIT